MLKICPGLGMLALTAPYPCVPARQLCSPPCVSSFAIFLRSPSSLPFSHSLAAHNFPAHRTPNLQGARWSHFTANETMSSSGSTGTCLADPRPSLHFQTPADAGMCTRRDVGLHWACMHGDGRRKSEAKCAVTCHRTRHPGNRSIHLHGACSLWAYFDVGRRLQIRVPRGQKGHQGEIAGATMLPRCPGAKSRSIERFAHRW